MINRIYTALAAAGVILLALFGIHRSGKRDGRNQAEAEYDKQKLEQIRKTQEAIYNANGKTISRDDVVKLLQDGEI